MENLNFYEILGVKEDATKSEIRKNYKKLAAKYHPDKSIDKDPKTKKENEEKFKNISIAYETLSDDNKRKEYDLSRKNGFQGFDGFGGFSGGFDFNGFHFDNENVFYSTSDNREGFFKHFLDFDGYKNFYEGNEDFNQYRKMKKEQRFIEIVKIKLKEYGMELKTKDNSYYIEMKLDVPFEKLYNGDSIELTLPIFNENIDLINQTTLMIKINPKTKNHSLMRLKEKGIVLNGKKLDIILILNIQEDYHFKNNTLDFKLNLDLFDVLSKTKKEYQILDKTYEIDLSKQDFNKKSLLKYNDMNIQVLVEFKIDYSILNKFDEHIIEKIQEIKKEIEHK